MTGSSDNQGTPSLTEKGLGRPEDKQKLGRTRKKGREFFVAYRITWGLPAPDKIASILSIDWLRHALYY